MPDSLQSTEEPYKIGDHVWVKPLNGWCTTRFIRGRVDGIINSQTVWVNGVPHDVKNLRLQLELTTSREDYNSEDTLTDSDSETPMLYAMRSDDLPTVSESTDSDNDEDDDDIRNAKNPQGIAMEVLPPEDPPLYE